MPQPEQKERKVTPAKRVQSILPWLGGGALGVAGLSEVARRGAFTPELLKDMSSFSQKLDNDQIFKPYAHLPEGEQNVQAMVDYAVQGNRLLNNRMWGVVSPTSIIKGLRSLPFLPDDWKWHSDAQQHYDTFERSPAGGFVRVLGELSHGGWGAKDPTYTQERGDLIRKAIRDATNATAGVNYADTSGGTPSWNFPTVGFPEQLSRDKQMGMMRNMAPALKEHITKQPDGASLWDAFSKYLQDGRRTVYNNYSRITDNLQNVNSGWGAVNTALAGVGAAGLGGYGIWRYLENKHKQDAKKRQKQSSMKQIHIANYLIKRATLNAALPSALIGAAAGGGLGAYLSKKNRLRGALFGGIGGGALGFGVGHIADLHSRNDKLRADFGASVSEGLGLRKQMELRQEEAAADIKRIRALSDAANSELSDYRRTSTQYEAAKNNIFKRDEATDAARYFELLKEKAKLWNERPPGGTSSDRLKYLEDWTGHGGTDESLAPEKIIELLRNLSPTPVQKRSALRGNHPIKRASFIEDLKAMATQPNEEQFSKLLRDKIRSNAMTTLAIAGGAPVLGALGGAGIQALRGSTTKNPKDKPSLLNGALLGGALGLGVGAAGGTAHLVDNLRQTWNDTPMGKQGPLDIPRFWTELLRGQPVTGAGK